MFATPLLCEQRVQLGAAARELSGRDILDVCRQAERRWVVRLLKGEVAEPPLPPLRQYEEALRVRLESSGEAPTNGVNGSNGREPRRVAARTPKSLGPSHVGTWGRSLSEVRPPGW